MNQRRNRLSFLLEMLGFLIGQMGMEHLDGRLQIEPHMLAQVHLGVAALSQQGYEPVVAKLLSHAVCHVWPPVLPQEARLSFQANRSCCSAYRYCKGHKPPRQV